MRTYSSFILFEDVLDFAPVDNPDLYDFVQHVTRPRVKMVEEDCLTKIGKLIDINFEIEGRIELATDLVITKTRIEEILADGIYRLAVRNLYNCTTQDGICRRCYAGTYIDQVAPAVGTFLRLEPEYNYQTDVFKCDGVKTDFPLSEIIGDYTKLLVIINGVIQTSGYTVSSANILSLGSAPAIGTNVVVKFFKITAQPFVGYLAETYTGSLLGLRPLTTQTINIRPSLAQTLFTDQELDIVKEKLATSYRTITRNYLEYIDNISNKLEKAVYLSMLYGLYSNVTA